MAYHPAAFARKALALLVEARCTLLNAGSDNQRIERLVAHYDRRAEELIRGRREMDRKAYRHQAISYFQWGGSIVFFMILLGVILYGEVADTAVGARYILLIGALGGLVGGALIMAWRAPKDLSYSEKKNSVLVKLYQDGTMLRTCCDAIIDPYRGILDKEERRVALQRQKDENRRQVQRANILLREAIREEKERKWTASDTVEQHVQEDGESKSE